ncbi:NirD/YgiW/YdeI family stress tolerance protein [Vibrio mediterranei]|uniref:YgiW/YdeI family stress tolerance OB fold protein n=1 Tax=Vibrio mediterranei TaxID=689 RepID=UPI0017A948E7|nr:NirD/YgiW/YdeI family stress tolerance protein [Vibrio mediterranei]NUW72243.1 NirD/YgiW/YdeI family stress tolerance protein [Vibrio mediterranei]
MKKVIITTALILTSGFAAAKSMPEQGGFNGPIKGAQTTVAQALSANDDAPVQITGNITHSLGDEKYQFTDGANTIVIEIDREDWRGEDVTPNDRVTITGSVDKDTLEDATVDVKRVVIAG